MYFQKTLDVEYGFLKKALPFSGMTQYLDTKCDKDALLVKLMKDMGAVPFSVTNVPQTCMTIQCSNPIFGATGSTY